MVGHFGFEVLDSIIHSGDGHNESHATIVSEMRTGIKARNSLLLFSITATWDGFSSLQNETYIRVEIKEDGSSDWPFKMVHSQYILDSVRTKMQINNENKKTSEQVPESLDSMKYHFYLYLRDNRRNIFTEHYPKVDFRTEATISQQLNLI